MFDWLPGLYWSATGAFFTGVACGAIPAFFGGIWCWQAHIARKEAKQLAADIEARIAECPDEIEAEEVCREALQSLEAHDEEDAAYRILHLVFDGKEENT